MNSAPVLPHARPVVEGRPLAVGASQQTRHAVQDLLEQAEHLDIDSPIAALARWRAAALVVIQSICGPDHIAWRILRPEAAWCPTVTAEAAKRDQAFADGWAITLGVLQGLLPSLPEADPGPRTLAMAPAVQQDETNSWAATTLSCPPAGIGLVLLGTPKVRGAHGPFESQRLSRLTEYAIWLHLNPGSDRHALDAALWPGRKNRADNRNSAMSRLRAWIGPAHFPQWSRETEYTLASSVTSDWQRFQELAARGESDISPAGAQSLRSALDLVNGPPFADVISPGWYEWAEPYVREMTQTITRVAHQLTHRNLEEGELPGAWWALRRGCQALPGGVKQFQIAVDDVRERYSESDSLRHLADQLTGRHTSFPDDSPYSLLG